MCHRQCMLQSFAATTHDPHLHYLAQRCAGRCMAWDLIPRGRSPWLSEGAGAEKWEGHWFTTASDVDKSRLGYHDSRCPLRNDRDNDLSPTTRIVCQSQVFDSNKKAWLQACCGRLQEMQCKETEVRKMLKWALSIEQMQSVLSSGSWIPAHCGSKHVVDPWSIGQRAVDCTRLYSPSHVVQRVGNLCRDLQLLLEGILLSAVLGDLFSMKKPSRQTLGFVPANIRLTFPEQTQEQEDEEDAQMDEDTHHLPVLQNFGQHFPIL